MIEYALAHPGLSLIYALLAVLVVRDTLNKTRR